METISLFFGLTKEPEKTQKMLEDFISLVKKFDAILIPIRDIEDNITGFEALTNGLKINAYGMSEEMVSQIRSEISQTYGIDYKIELKNSIVTGLDFLPKQIADAFKSDPDHVSCPRCKKLINISFESKFCPYCGKQAVKDDFYSSINVCINCPNDNISKDRIYHQSFQFCPKCGRKLKTVKGYNLGDYLLTNEDESMLMKDGLPLDDFDFAKDIKKVKKARKK